MKCLTSRKVLGGSLWASAALACIVCLNSCLNNQAAHSGLSRSEVLIGSPGISATTVPNLVIGGWTQQTGDWPAASDDLKRLNAHLAVEKPGIVLGKVLSVESQVVAGFNVRLNVLYTIDQRTERLEALFYHSFDTTVQLSALKLGLPVEP